MMILPVVEIVLIIYREYRLRIEGEQRVRMKQVILPSWRYLYRASVVEGACSLDVHSPSLARFLLHGLYQNRAC